tara:strand:+ start:81 stop:521 length:441 start_codon:yes stop_codon:yes gene_type:complete
MKIIEPRTNEEFIKYYLVRYEVLRKPWGQSIGSEKDESDKDSIHRMIIDPISENALAVGRLQFNSDDEAQIRYMAVHEKAQGKGLGTQLIRELEAIALSKDVRWIILQARENALSFYENNGYKVIKKTHLLFDRIQHWMMKKKLVN